MKKRKAKSERMYSFNRAIRKILELQSDRHWCPQRSLLNAIAILYVHDWIGENAANNLRSYFGVSK